MGCFISKSRPPSPCSDTSESDVLKPLSMIKIIQPVQHVYQQPTTYEMQRNVQNIFASEYAKQKQLTFK